MEALRFGAACDEDMERAIRASGRRALWMRKERKLAANMADTEDYLLQFYAHR